MRIAVFASGSGSNFQSIVDATLEGRLDARVELCVSSRPDAGVVDRARLLGIPVLVLSGSIDVHLAELKETLETQKIDIIALAGFLKKIPSELIQLDPLRILNIHPALLPQFGGPGMYGMRVHEAVLAAKETISGATVHIVDEEYDSGPIVMQRTVPVLPTDTATDLAARVLKIEHELYPEALQLFAKNQITINGRKVSY
ncbi:MAG: phosphoribosylglycinamide formyltransferase [Bacteroidetes bacterium]|nr:phosphoribosylglycinamide formyltransferase [Bacteroidota bacterium]